jgi:hypothetical protein
MVRMKQEEFRTLLQGCLDDISPFTQNRAALLNNRAFMHQCLGDLIEARRELAERGLVAGIDPADVASDDEGQAEFEERWPPNDDPFPSDELEHSRASNQAPYQPMSPRNEGRQHVLFNRALIDQLTAARLAQLEEEKQEAERVHSQRAFDDADSVGRFLRMAPIPEASGEDSEERLLGGWHLPGNLTP